MPKNALRRDFVAFEQWCDINAIDLWHYLQSFFEKSQHNFR